MPVFPLGRVFATPGLRETCGLVWIHECLARHGRGDWGDVSPEDADANDRAVLLGGRVFSAYPLAENGVVASTSSLWIVTEADRALTTCLLPSEYKPTVAPRTSDGVGSIARPAMRGRSS